MTCVPLHHQQDFLTLLQQRPRPSSTNITYSLHLINHGYPSQARQFGANIKHNHLPTNFSISSIENRNSNLIALPSDSARGPPPLNLPNNSRPRQSIQHPLSELAIITLQPRLTIPRTVPRAILLCEKIQCLQRLLCENRLGVDNLCLRPLRHQPLVARPTAVTNSHPKTRKSRTAIPGHHDGMDVHDAVVFRPANR